jgi:hypothetical protein
MVPGMIPAMLVAAVLLLAMCLIAAPAHRAQLWLERRDYDRHFND